jgi:hypothetical protein
MADASALALATCYAAIAIGVRANLGGGPPSLGYRRSIAAVLGSGGGRTSAATARPTSSAATTRITTPISHSIQGDQGKPAAATANRNAAANQGQQGYPQQTRHVRCLRRLNDPSSFHGDLSELLAPRDAQPEHQLLFVTRHVSRPNVRSATPRRLELGSFQPVSRNSTIKFGAADQAMDASWHLPDRHADGSRTRARMLLFVVRFLSGRSEGKAAGQGHSFYAPMTGKFCVSHLDLRRAAASTEDPLERRAANYLADAHDRGLQAMLDGAMRRSYSASPAEAFFTGGHIFHNFLGVG